MKILIPIGNYQLPRKDDQFQLLQEMIDAKRESLIKKQKTLHFLSKENSFLQGIRDDYSKYNKYIAQQKQDQMTALSILNNYIQDLSATGELSKQNIEDARSEQKKILEEIDSIKNNLDSLLEKVEQK
jgi:protein-tyrosine phosphatase